MKHPLTFIYALLLAPLAALQAAEPPRKIGDVHAPVWVGRPPSDAVSGLVRLENGELRHYDYGIDPTPELRSHPDFLPTSYVFSRDQGLTWETQKVPKGHYGADARSPVSGEYLRLQDNKDGVYLIKSKGGIDGEWTMRRLWEIKPPGSEFNITPTVMFIRGGKRAIVPWSLIRYNTPEHHHQAGVLFSDDDGETWQRSNLLEAPPHQPDQRDLSVRWQNGATEPTVVELRDGRLWMIIRTSLDYHYQSFSADGGATWSQPEQSPFYGTITSPRIGRLKDGRLLFIWNNTTSPSFESKHTGRPFTSNSATPSGKETKSLQATTSSLSAVLPASTSTHQHISPMPAEPMASASSTSPTTGNMVRAKAAAFLANPHLTH
jgi:hypothetical protein